MVARLRHPPATVIALQPIGGTPPIHEWLVQMIEQAAALPSHAPVRGVIDHLSVRIAPAARRHRELPGRCRL
jgi:hypothetical protein